jgi:hypothetical protein
MYGMYICDHGEDAGLSRAQAIPDVSHSADQGPDSQYAILDVNI